MVKEERPPSIQRQLLSRYVLSNRRKVAFLASLTLTSTCLQILAPLLCRRFIDLFVSGAGPRAALPITEAFLVVALLGQIMAICDAYVAQDLIWASTNCLRLDLIRHCLQLDPEFFKDNPPGALIERVDGDVSELSGFLSRFMINVVTNACLVLGIIGVLCVIQRVIGFCFLGFTVLAIIALTGIQTLGKPWWLAQREVATESMSYIEERLSAGPELVANGADSYILKGFCIILRRFQRTSRNASFVDLLIGTLSFTCIVVGQAMVAGLGAYYYLHGAISVGTIVLLFGYMVMMIRPLNDLAGQLTGASKAATSMRRIGVLFEAKPRISPERGESLQRGACSLEFREMTFGYVASEPVLRNVNLQIHPHEVVVLVGRTGCGKSTVARLLFRQYDPDVGAVFWNGSNLRDVSLEDLRSRIGLVSQEVQILAVSVRDNLTLFDASIPDNKIVEILGMLGMSDWLKRLSDGLDTRLNRNSMLSAGEAQLLAFARVYLKDPDLIILDEITAHVDPNTAQRLEKAIDRLIDRRTVLVIAHNPAFIRRATRILTIEDGAVVEISGERPLQAQ